VGGIAAAVVKGDKKSKNQSGLKTPKPFRHLEDYLRLMDEEGLDELIDG